MTTAWDKAKISGLTGIVGAFAATFYGYINLVMLVGLGTFFLTLLIQYNAFKIKILIPVGIILSFVYWIFSHHGGLP